MKNKYKNTLPRVFACLLTPLLLNTSPAVAKDALAGQTSATVTQSLGQPESKKAAVGSPPISRWLYENATVYFEHDRVIHIVKE